MSGTTDGAEPRGTMLFAGAAVDILVSAAATDGACALLRIVHPPGCWTPPHLHRDEDETVLVLSGTLRAETMGHAADLGAGQVIVLPRGQAHRLGNTAAEEVRFLVLCTPGGFDGFVRAAGRTMPDGGPVLTEADIARLIQAAPRHGVELLAPDALGHPVLADRAAATVELDVLATCIRVLARRGATIDPVVGR